MKNTNATIKNAINELLNGHLRISTEMELKALKNPHIDIALTQYNSDVDSILKINEDELITRLAKAL